MGVRVDLLSNVGVTGSAAQWPGGIGSFACNGTFGGATVTLQVLGPDGTNYLAVSATTTITAAGGANFLLPPSTIRALVAGGSPSGLYATAVQVHP